MMDEMVPRMMEKMRPANECSRSPNKGGLKVDRREPALSVISSVYQVAALENVDDVAQCIDLLRRIAVHHQNIGLLPGLQDTHRLVYQA